MSNGFRARRSALRRRTALTGAITTGLVLASAATAHAWAPKVIVKSKPSHTTRSTTALLRFSASGGGGGFPLSARRWPMARLYESAEVRRARPGPHRVAIRASGRHAGTPVKVAWTVHPAARRGSAKLRVSYLQSDASGIAFYNVTSSDDGNSAQVLRVLTPTKPAHGVPHNFLYVLPVEQGLGTYYGDGIETLRQLNAQNKYNLTIVEPSFPVEPWFANNPTDPNIQYETFMANNLVHWVSKNLATTGKEQNWLLGFSKSGVGAQDLILKHPDVFTAAASWDFPAGMDAYRSDKGKPVGDGLNYGTDANFQSNYRLTPSFVGAHSGPFHGKPRIWIGSYGVLRDDVADYDALLTSQGIAHTTEPPQLMLHRWDSGWVPIALRALSQDGRALPPGP